jgi:hypothetical protein
MRGGQGALARRVAAVAARAQGARRSHLPADGGGDSAPASGVLVRDFVCHSLYGKGVGYFQQGDVVGSVWDRARLDPGASSSDGSGRAFTSEGSHAAAAVARSRAPDVSAGPGSPAAEGGSAAGLDFKNMLGEMEYRHVVAQLYAQGGSAWLTPCELFHPWYSRAVARFVVEQLHSRRPQHSSGSQQGPARRKLRVLEIGGGNGTFALGFLDYLQAHHKDIYRDAAYTLVEVSSKLGKTCPKVSPTCRSVRTGPRQNGWLDGADTADRCDSAHAAGARVSAPRLRDGGQC